MARESDRPSSFEKYVRASALVYMRSRITALAALLITPCCDSENTMTLHAILEGGQGVIYTVTDTGQLLFYRDEARNGNGVWAYGGIGKEIGTGWSVFRHVISGDDGIIYAIDGDGTLRYYRDVARNGNGVWAFGGVGQPIGTGWGAFRHVLSGGDGVIYAIDANGALIYYRDEARNGNGVWSHGGAGRQIGSGWGNFRQVFSGGGGVIYAINADGDLLYYRDEARNGNGVWSFGGVGQRIGTGWSRFRRVFSGGDGIIYAVNANNELLYFRDEARNGTGRWSFGGIGQRIGVGWDALSPSFQLATRWGVCIVTFGGAPRGTRLSKSWARKAFSGGDGVAGYFERMSGGRHRIEAEVFGPMEIMAIAQKQAATAMGGAGAEITAFRAAARARGVPVERFDRMMWVIDDGVSTLGTTPSDSLVGALDLTPQTAAHEMLHSSGVCSHADKETYDDYQDAFCIMGASTLARGFVNQQLSLPLAPMGIGRDLTHALSGPGVCTPYLYVAGWLDSVANTTALPLAHARGATFVLDANQGAPRFGSTSRVALTSGPIPQRVGDPAQYWVEYRHPSGDDRGINRASASANPDLPTEGVLMVHKVEMLSARCTDLHAYLRNTVGAKQGNTLRVNAALSFRVSEVDAVQRRVWLAVA